MKFSRSLFGYEPEEVKRIRDKVLEKYESDNKAFISLLKDANREYDKLLEQRNILTANLQSTRDNSLYLYNKEVFDITLNRAERNAFLKMEEITEDQRDFMETINKTIKEFDNILALLKQEFLETTDALDKTIDSIITKLDDKEEVSASLENTMEDLYSNNKKPAEPFKALSFDRSKYNIATPAQVKPEIVPVKKNNNVISISTRTKSTETVLIAENDSEISSLLSHVLEREGFDIVLVPDGYILLNMIKEKEPPGIIILDTLLPYIQSNILIKEIRESKAWYDVPILVTTSEHNKQVTIEALEWGANDSLEKPFNLRELVARVKRLNNSSAEKSYKVGD